MFFPAGIVKKILHNIRIINIKNEVIKHVGLSGTNFINIKITNIRPYKRNINHKLVSKNNITGIHKNSTNIQIKFQLYFIQYDRFEITRNDTVLCKFYADIEYKSFDDNMIQYPYGYEYEYDEKNGELLYDIFPEVNYDNNKINKYLFIKNKYNNNSDCERNWYNNIYCSERTVIMPNNQCNTQ